MTGAGTGAGAARIARSDLVLGRPLGDGGQGRVWAVEKRLVNRTWPVAFKEYHPKALGELRVDVLERMVAHLPSRPASEGRWLAGNTAWPAALVTDGQDVRGFLMRQIPDEYFLTLRGGARKPAGFEFLLNPEAYLRNVVGVVPSPRQLFGLLLALAEMLDRLHGLGVVAGDLSPKNLLFSLSGPRPGCFLIDCDAMGLHGAWALEPVQTPAWQLPGGERAETRQGDAYKFALLAVRLFMHEQQGQDPAPLRALDPAVGELAARGLGADPARRPAPGDWLDALSRAAESAPKTWPRPAPPSPAHAPTTVMPPVGAPRGAASAAASGTPPAAPPTGVPGPGGPVPAGVHTGRAPAAGGAPPYGPGQRPGTTRKGSGRSAGCVVVLLLVVAFLVWRGLGDSGSDGGGSAVEPGGGTGTGASTPTTSARQERARDQAEGLDKLLTDNSGHRSGVADAVQSLLRCTGLRDAESVFGEAAEARATLVERLDALDLDRLPTGLAGDLRTAWRSSEDADRAYARLADDASGSCSSDSIVSSADWREAAEANKRATAAKKDFVAGWNPVAGEYGLTTLAWTDL